ncbi:hypothetical protein JI435_070940 [Parastagonospora nodorum SN15]|uniref:Transcription factor domain-containing protein n=1 Tax=Phaeosphaeria nodorum (strain SN15 / ATCC MYA-4574 / FGSC 10173) TaxID=321614 RepID=A0A7U2I1T6_PHANO|nr:hypothetical protein JI435_070940 [Parastagonospora nodorum SN15]
MMSMSCRIQSVCSLLRNLNCQQLSADVLISPASFSSPAVRDMSCPEETVPRLTQGCEHGTLLDHKICLGSGGREYRCHIKPTHWLCWWALCSNVMFPNVDLKDAHRRVLLQQTGKASGSAESTDNGGEARNEKERRFFEHVQPTFAVELPTTTRLEFLDERNPAKRIIVRKKAREWVNQNKSGGKKSRSRRRPAKKEETETDVGSTECQNAQVQRHGSDDAVKVPSPLQDIGVRQFDPFTVLPDVGSQYDHLLDYFLRGCPGAAPSLQEGRTSLIPIMNTTDEYAQGSRHSIIPFASASTIFHELGQSQVTFALLLYAVVSIREGVSGISDIPELYNFYNHALRSLQTSLSAEIASGVFSDHLLLALGIIAAIACFSGSFDTAVLHRNALVKILEIRGKGSILAGIRTTSPWTQKALQWLELLIAIQTTRSPLIPYIPPAHSLPLPTPLSSEAQRRTSHTLTFFPHLADPLKHIVLLLHQLGVAYNRLPTHTRTDVYVIAPLYDAQYSLLTLLSMHRETGDLGEVEYLLAETMQLYFAVGPRAQPPQMRLLDLLVARVKGALQPFIDRDMDKPTGYAVAWALCVGCIVAGWVERPEGGWFWARVRAHLGGMGGGRVEGDAGGFPDGGGVCVVGYGWVMGGG